MTGKKGFTLIELIISITVVGMIIVIISASLRLGYRSMDSGEKKAEYIERMKSSFMFFQSQVQSLVPLAYNDGGETKYRFSGSGDSVSFPTCYSIWGEGAVMATYSVVADKDGKKALYLSEEALSGPAKGQDSGVRLRGGFDELRFDFYYRSPSDEKGRWFESWDDEGHIPSVIRLHMVEAGKDLYMPVKVRAEGAEGAGAYEK